ncbi:MAG: 2,4-dienoyl-CoA reductase-like NADH-dependent reductase (Old Yellow Enzyme family) [Flavobacterium sp.]|jgi:2,4-dienoyl-CoA reductase-like NADH-dependent reductase (Old Yellow Enzyme family)
MSALFSPLGFTRGPEMKNRFMLAPLTNTQSGIDGVLSDEEFIWLTMRSEGGFGLTMTCAAHVQKNGQGFPGQLGVFSDDHIEGLSRLANKINENESVSICQLHHAGMRSPEALIGEAPVCPSADSKTGARALTTNEVESLVEDFVLAALRAEKAGFNGVEIHGAHGYILGQFISPEINQRSDQYGGVLENRTRIIFEIIEGIRRRCDKNFSIGIRLSPERFGMLLSEVLILSQQLMDSGKIDFLDMSLWDVFKDPVEEEFKGRSLMSYFTDLNRGDVRLGVAGKIQTPADAERALVDGADWVMLGRAAILNHDFPNQYRADTTFQPTQIPVTRDHLFKEGLSEKFIKYMSSWAGFIEIES